MAKRALVVDNDRFYVELLGDVLGQEGYEVAKAYDGMEAMELLDGELPDLVVLDIVMPKIDGDRVCQYIKGSPRLRQIPVIILSGTLVEDHEKMLAMGADAYVAKGRLDELRVNILATLRRLEGTPTGGPQSILVLDKAVPREQVKELLAIKRHKEAILRAIGEGVVEVDGRQRVLYVNPAGLAILSRPELELIGTPLTDILTADHRTTLQEAVARLRASPDKTGDAVSLRYRDRVLRIAFAWILPDDPDSGFFMIMQDITDLARKIEELSTLNARLQELERLRSEFLAMVSHDLHTPLTAIKGSMEVLLHEGVGIELSRELLGIAQKNTDRLFRMVSDILDLARIEAGRFEIRREPFDVVVGLRGTIDRLRRLAQDRQISLTLQAGDGLPLVPADSLRMDQVFTNLLSNAMKFTPRSGQIGVTVQELPAELLVQIQDSGMGIPAEHLDRIFERFYRVPLPAEEKVEGTGLGLSICKAIVEEHGGRIWVESAVGKGSTFSFTLPKGPPAA
ncbi:MAG: response regulator [candidate division NC10 bacterium]|nr:response regulator [candidate division NC10 bacterium]